MGAQVLWFLVALLAAAEGFNLDAYLFPDVELELRHLVLRGNTTKRFDTDKFLEKYGYLAEAPPNAQRSPEDRIAAIKDFQRMNGLHVTGKVDRATRRKMKAPRCGNPDVIREERREGEPQELRLRPQHFYVPGYRWRRTSLSWRVLNTSPDMDPGQQRRAFANALQYWSDVSGLDFEERAEGDSDLTVQFVYGNHGDGYQNAFDQRGGVLAHAFYPEEGRAHFDEAEKWSAHGAVGTDLETVAAHEFGHALGLGHSEQPEALMAPYYKGYDPNLRLHKDDIRAIQTLYGNRPVTPRPGVAPTPTPASTDPDQGADIPNICTMKYDAIVRGSDGGLYVFHGSKVWKLNAWAVEKGYPVETGSLYNRLPHTIGAAVYSPDTHYTYFFKGRSIYQYYRSHRIGNMRLDGDQDPSSPQAAFLSRSNKIFVLQGVHAWKFDEVEQRYTGGTTRISAIWPGLPGNTEAAVRLQDGFLYVIKGDKYRKYDEYGRRTMPGYPRDKAGPFMGPACGGRYVPK